MTPRRETTLSLFNRSRSCFLMKASLSLDVYSKPSGISIPSSIIIESVPSGLDHFRTPVQIWCYLDSCNGVICFTTVLDQSSLCSNKFYALCFTPILLVRYDTNFNNMYQM